MPEGKTFEDYINYDKKTGKSKGYKFTLSEAVDVFCIWMNQTRGIGTLERSAINVISAADAKVDAPKVEHVFDINNTNMTNWEFILGMVDSTGFYPDFENKRIYLNLKVFQMPGAAEDFISKFCVQLDEDELEENTFPQVILVGSDSKQYVTQYYVKSSMFMSIQGYLNGLMRR